MHVSDITVFTIISIVSASVRYFGESHLATLVTETGFRFLAKSETLNHIILLLKNDKS